MAQHERPVEHEAVRTTIVGGRPPGSGKPVGPIPRGIEVLIKKAAVDAEFKRVLLEKRADAAREIGLLLDPAEALMLKAATAAQLETIIARTTVAPSILPAFLGRAAAVMLVALGAGAVGCSNDNGPPVTGITPDAPPAKQTADTAQPSADAPKPDTPPPTTKGIRPDVPETKPDPAPPVAPPAVTGVRPDVPEPRPMPDPTGIRPDRPEAKPAPAPETPAATDTTPAPAPEAKPTGIRPDRPEVKPDPAAPRLDIVPEPTATGVRPDRPQSRAAEPGHTLILADADQPAPPPPPPPMPPTGIRPDRPATAPTPPAEPSFTGVRPDNPPAPTGVRPDKPATTDTTKQDDLKKQVAVTALKVPEDWNEQKFAEVLGTRLKALAEKSLPGAKITVQNDEKGRRVRIEWKTQKYDPQASPPVAVLGARPATPETGPAADGLILDAWLEPGLDLVNRPKVLDNGGRWETRQDQVFVIPLKKCLKFDASWGPKTDRQIVATFSTAQRWFEGESVSTQTYVPPDNPATTPNPATSRGARPDRPAPKPQEGPAMPMAGVPAYRPDDTFKPAPEPQPPAVAPAPAPPPPPGRAAGVQVDRPVDESK